MTRGVALTLIATSAQVDEVRAAIDAIHDGVHGRAQLSPSKMRPDGEAGPSRGAINIEARTYGESYFTSTAESSRFRQVRQLPANHAAMPVHLASTTAHCDAASCALLLRAALRRQDCIEAVVPRNLPSSITLCVDAPTAGFHAHNCA